MKRQRMRISNSFFLSYNLCPAEELIPTNVSLRFSSQYKESRPQMEMKNISKDKVSSEKIALRK